MDESRWKPRDRFFSNFLQSPANFPPPAWDPFGTPDSISFLRREGCRSTAASQPDFPVNSARHRIHRSQSHGRPPFFLVQCNRRICEDGVRSSFQGPPGATVCFPGHGKARAPLEPEFLPWFAPFKPDMILPHKPRRPQCDDQPKRSPTPPRSRCDCAFRPGETSADQ